MSENQMKDRIVKELKMAKETGRITSEKFTKSSTKRYLMPCRKVKAERKKSVPS